MATGGEARPEIVVKALVQRVQYAQVRVAGHIVGRIGSGLLIFLGVGKSDTAAEADYLVGKLTGLRIFSDADGRMNCSVLDAGGSLLVVSQFTLFGDTRKGRRPSFDGAADPDQAKLLYEHFLVKARERGLNVQAGQFQAHMEVELLNDGPVTILCESPIEWRD